MQTRQPNLEGAGEIPLRRLVKEGLRMRPSRIVVDEVRQEECLDPTQSSSTTMGPAVVRWDLGGAQVGGAHSFDLSAALGASAWQDGDYRLPDPGRRGIRSCAAMGRQRR